MEHADGHAARAAAGGGPARRAAGRGGAVDRSVEVHACHGRARQVEVVRDAILHLLADDPTLEPRDVIVMCPDIEAFAPLIQATFGAGEIDEDDELEVADRPPDLRVRLADRSLRQTNPVLGVVARLLELAGQRLTASQVLELAEREPVRRRFRLDDDDVARLEDWVRTSGIRWGLDAEHRAPFKLAGAADRHVALRAGPAAARRDDERGRAAAVRRRAAARRRRERRDRPRRAAGGVRRPPPRGDRRAAAASRPCRAWAAALGGGGRRADGDVGAGRVAALGAAAAARRRRRRGRRLRRVARARPRSARCWPSACRVARRARTSAPAT